MVNKKKVFVIISFSEKFENVFEFAIKPAVEEAGLIAEKADGKDKAIRDIYKDIAEKLVSSELVIVDISKVEDEDGKLISLDNVYYELGLAHGINKRVIFLTQDTNTDIPYDLKQLDAIPYNPDKIKDLQSILKEKIPQALNDEPTNFFEDIEIKYNNKFNTSTPIEKKVHKNIFDYSCEVEKLLEALNDFFFNDIALSSIMKLKLEKLNFIEIKYKVSMPNESVEYIDITEKGAEFMEHNRVVLNNQKLVRRK